MVDAPRCIMAAIDEGRSAAEALAAGTALARAYRLPLIALHVLSPRQARMTVSSACAAALRRRRACNSPADMGGGLTLALGDAARAIVAAGTRREGGVLVVGKRGADASPVGSLGSVARELLATSPLPVLAIEVPASPIGTA
jgi:nucleotide-binding universal stress UspA family protein